jgi:hypothetical protein
MLGWGVIVYRQRGAERVKIAEFDAKGLPANRSPLVVGDDYVLPAGYNGPVVKGSEFEAVPADETLFIEIWDLS